MTSMVRSLTPLPSMNNVDAITSLEAKIRTLIADHKRLKSLLAEAATQLRALEQDKRELQQKSHNTERELSRLQLSEALAGSSPADEKARDKARARVNRLLREIDQCLSLLND